MCIFNHLNWCPRIQNTCVAVSYNPGTCRDQTGGTQLSIEILTKLLNRGGAIGCGHIIEVP